MALEVIGPGFGRTGTNSLKIALEQLGFGPCHHMFEVRDDPARLPVWVEAGAGVPMDWERVFDGYRSQTDWPGARYWRELIEAFSRAKVVLTVRDPDDWFDSVQATIAPFLSARGTHETPHMNAIASMAHETLMLPTFGDGLDNRDHATAVFRAHIAEVQASVDPDRLLTFDVREGWPALCAFLGVPVPDTPFPRTNSSKQFVEEEWRKDSP